MRVDVAREHGGRLEGATQRLLSAEPHLAYANFPPIAQRAGALLALHARHWLAAADRAGVLVARDEHDQPLAMLRLEHRDFESQHFGRLIARIDTPAALPDEEIRLAALRPLYEAARALLHERGYQHVTAASSTQDRVACWAIQEAGAFHVGTRISWMQALMGRVGSPELPPNLRIEVYDKARIPTLAPAAWRRLLDWTGEAFDRGPFVFDLNLPRERATRVYQVWTQKAMTGEWADVLLVVRDGDEVVAFHTMMLLPDLSEAAGVRILGRGIGGTLPGYRGLFTVLQKETAAIRPLGAGFLENETQAATIPSINVFGKLGHQCIRSTASFHMRLDGTLLLGRQRLW